MQDRIYIKPRKIIGVVTPFERYFREWIRENSSRYNSPEYFFRRISDLMIYEELNSLQWRKVKIMTIIYTSMRWSVSANSGNFHVFCH